MMATLISIVALVIAIASFGFTLYQYKNNQSLSKLGKINEVLIAVFDFRRESQDLRDLINITDDIDSNEEGLDVIDAFCEKVTTGTLNNPKTTLAEVYHVEKGLLELKLSFDLLSKQIKEQIRFNEECAKFDKN